MATLSFLFRQKGNVFYNDELNDRECTLLASGYEYHTAIHCADNNLDLSSGCKNYSIFAFELFKIYTERNQNTFTQYYAELFQEYSQKALESAKHVQCKEWFDQMIARQIHMADIYINDFIKNLKDDDDKKHFLLTNLKVPKISNYMKYLVFYELAMFSYKSSIRHMNLDLSQSHKALQECNSYLNKCVCNWENFHLKLLIDFEIVQNCSIQKLNIDKLKKQNDIQENIIEAKLLIVEADKLYEKFLKNKNISDTDRVWQSIVIYEKAILSLKDSDLESKVEILAEINSKIGIAYHAVKLNVKAKICLNRCVDLVESLKPKIFTNCVWYQRCLDAIQKFQDEEKQRAKQKETPIVNDKDDVKHDLKKILKEKGDENFIKFVYENYPPKNKNPSPLNNDNFKKVIKWSLFDYHEDKNLAKTYGYQWFSIAKEITKYLGQIYDRNKFKG